MSPFSLPTQRCFWRSFALSLEEVAFLCLRRGVSSGIQTSGARRRFSLPTQRCFYLFERGADDGKLFSAYAEVFPQA